jgi:hypothetical protein
VLTQRRSLAVLPVVCLAAVVLATHFSSPGRAAGRQTMTYRGTTLLQGECLPDPGNTQMFGPFTTAFLPLGYVGNSSWYCDSAAYPSDGQGVPLATGSLHNLRVVLAGGTLDGSNPALSVAVWVNGVLTPIACTATIVVGHEGLVCEDNTHWYRVKSLDQISILVTIPDSNTFLGWGQTSIELSIVE